MGTSISAETNHHLESSSDSWETSSSSSTDDSNSSGNQAETCMAAHHDSEDVDLGEFLLDTFGGTHSMTTGGDFDPTITDLADLCVV